MAERADGGDSGFKKLSETSDNEKYDKLIIVVGTLEGSSREEGTSDTT